MTKFSIETCVAALNRAAMNRKAAFQIELASGLAVFLVNDGTTKEAKTVLCSAYASAGYQCLTPQDMDYKTINRRVNVTADLFNTLRVDKVKRWAGRHNDQHLIDALVSGLQPYELYGVRDVERLCKPPAPKVEHNNAPVSVAPATGILLGPVTNGTPSGQKKVADMFRYAAAEVAKGAKHIETEHLAIMIPDAVTSDELVQMAARLLSLAEERTMALAVA